MMNFAGKRVFVAGGTTSIGKGVAETFLAASARVAVHGRESDELARVLQNLDTPLAQAAPGDVSTVDGCQRLVDSAVSTLGGLDVLVISGQDFSLSSPMHVTEEHWDDAFNENLRAAYFSTKFALPALRASRGNIVFLASIAGLIAGPADSIVYSMSQAGIVNMTKALALELATDGIRVNAVCYGYVDALPNQNPASQGEIDRFNRDIIPLGRIGNPCDVASSVLYLASDLASYCTGSLLVNDGGCWAQARRGGVNSRHADAPHHVQYVTSES